MKPRILIVNDDGIYSTGIKALSDAMIQIGEVTIVAPDKEQSAKSHSISLTNPIRVKAVKLKNGLEGWSVDGTPVDCAKVAIKNIFVFPGVPEILQIMFKDFIKSLAKQKKYCKRNVTTTLSEGIIGDFVEKVQNEFQDVEIGSYPYFKKNSFGVSLVIRGDLKKNVDTVSRKIFDYLQSKKGNPRLF